MATETWMKATFPPGRASEAAEKIDKWTDPLNLTPFDPSNQRKMRQARAMALGAVLVTDQLSTPEPAEFVVWLSPDFATNAPELVHELGAVAAEEPPRAGLTLWTGNQTIYSGLT